MIETPGESEQPRYPVFWVRLEEIDYLFSSPEFNDQKSGEPYRKKYYRWEDWLVEGRGGETGEGKYMACARVFKNIGTDRLREPLIIGQSRNYKYYTSPGNRQLCCLRAYERLGRLETIKGLSRDPDGVVLVPTYIRHPDDSWQDTTRARVVQNREN